jgi:hypothetical protein
MLQRPYAIATHWWLGKISDSFSCILTSVFQQEGGDGDQRVFRQGPWQPDVCYIVASHSRWYCWESVFQSQGREGRRRFGTDHQSERHETVQVARRQIVPGHHQELATFQSRNEHVSIGLFFHQIGVVITQHRNMCKNSKLVGLNNHMVGQFVRVLLIITL